MHSDRILHSTLGTTFLLGKKYFLPQSSWSFCWFVIMDSRLQLLLNSLRWRWGRERERCWVQLVIHPNPALVMADMQRKDSTTAVKHIALHFFPSFQCIFRFTPNWRHMDGWQGYPGWHMRSAQDTFKKKLMEGLLQEWRGGWRVLFMILLTVILDMCPAKGRRPDFVSTHSLLMVPCSVAEGRLCGKQLPDG